MEQNMDPTPFQEPQHLYRPNDIDSCDECRDYWDHMRDEGLWVDGVGWTDKAKREWNK